MKLLLEELAPGRWQVEVLPTCQEDLDKGMFSEIDIAAILLGISYDLVNKIATEGKEEKDKPLLQIPTNPDRVLRELKDKKK